MKRYLTNNDYRVICTPEDLEAVSQGFDAYVMGEAESYAAELGASYLRVYARARFDLGRIFIPVSAYEISASYQPGDHVYDSSQVMHVALQAASGVPLSQATHFVQADYRLPAPKSWMTNISLYRMYMSVMPDNIPEHRRLNYEDAIGQMRAVSQGTLDPGLPQVEDSSTMRFGTNKKRNWYP